MVRSLNFCPRNEFLHRLIAEWIYVNHFGMSEPIDKIVVHHVTCVDSAHIRVEYEV